MKKLRLLSFILLLCTLVSTFASCGDSDDDSESVFDIKEPTVYTKGKKIELISDIYTLSYQYAGSLSTYCIGMDNEKLRYVVYDLEQDRILFDYLIENPDDPSPTTVSNIQLTPFAFREVNGYCVIYFNNNSDVLKSEIYLKDVTAPALSIENGPGYFEVDRSGQHLLLGSQLYRVSGNKLELVFEITDESNLPPHVTASNGDYLYAVEENSLQRPSDSILIYDNKYEFCYEYSAPEDALDVIFCNLPGGRFLCQYKLASDESDYDYIYRGVYDDRYYKLFHVIIDPSKKTDHAVERDFMITTDYYTNTSEYLADGYVFTNKVDVIKDGKIDSTHSFVVLNDELEIVFSVNRVVERAVSAEVISSDRILVKDSEGVFHLLDTDGKVICKLNDLLEHNEKYLLKRDAIYDMNNKKLFDYSGKGYVLLDDTDSAMIFTKRDGEDKREYYFFADGEMTLLGAEQDGFTIDEDDIEDEYFGAKVVSADGTKYVYYNSVGNKLVESPEALRMIHKNNSGQMLLRTNYLSSGKFKVYRFSVK